MDRRSFLATGCAAVATGFAGCGTSAPEEPEWKTVTEAVGGSGGSEGIGGSEASRGIEDVEGLEGSRVFEGVELEDDGSSLKVDITREATLELGVTAIESGTLCGTDEFPFENEWELGRGERFAYIPLTGCAGTCR